MVTALRRRREGFALKALKQAVVTVCFYLALAHLGAMSLTWNLACVLLYPLMSRRQGTVVGRAAISSVYRGFWRCLVWTGVMRLENSEALDVLEKNDKGLIIAANHPSALDALLIVARVPRGICIMRASLMQNPCLGYGAKLARYIRNDPPHAMVKSAVENLKEGGQLIMFPEGTRTVEPPVNDFLPGTTLIAHMAQVPIQTVIIETDSPYLGKGWPIWKPPAFPMGFRVRLGRRFEPEADHQGLTRKLKTYFEGELRR